VGAALRTYSRRALKGEEKKSHGEDYNGNADHGAVKRERGLSLSFNGKSQLGGKDRRAPRSEGRGGGGTGDKKELKLNGVTSGGQLAQPAKGNGRGEGLH